MAHGVVQTNTHAQIHTCVIVCVYVSGCVCVCACCHATSWNHARIYNPASYVSGSSRIKKTRLCHSMLFNAHLCLLNAWLMINEYTYECVHAPQEVLFLCDGNLQGCCPVDLCRWNRHYGMDSQQWFETMKCPAFLSILPICQPPPTMLGIIWGVNPTVPEGKENSHLAL